MTVIDDNREWTDAIDVYSQYFNAKATFNNIERRAATVKLTALKDIEGNLGYQISASFFPFRDEEDFGDPADAVVKKLLLLVKRRNKKKEALMLEEIQKNIDELLPELDENAVIYWDKPLREARMG